MRAAAQAHPSEVPVSTARQALARVLLALVATLILIAMWKPTVVHAQKPQAAATASAPTAPQTTDSATTTHVVKAGESLWLLAERYYGDGHQWQELARRNSLSTDHDKVLFVGMKLRVPAHPSAATKRVASDKDAKVPDIARQPAVAAAKPSTTEPTVSATTSASKSAPKGAPKGASLAAQTADKADAAPAAASPRTVRAPASAGKTVVASSKTSNTNAPKSETRVAARARVAAADSVARKPRADTTESATVFSRASVAAALDSARVGSNRGRSDTLMAPRTATHIGLVDAEDLRASRGAKEVATVFLRRVPDQAEVDAQARAISRTDAPAPRRGEYEGAPFSVEASALLKSGRLLRRIGARAGGSPNDPQRLTIADQVEISAPAGVTLAVGDRLVSVHVHEVTKGVNVAVPTGIVRVVKVESGKPTLAMVQSQTGGIEQGQSLLVIQGTAAPLSARASASASNDLETTVRWIDGTESLPTLQSYVLLGAGSAQGVQAGDEFDLHTVKGPTSGGEERIARARVVRVGTREATAIIVRQERAEIAVGVPARRVARVP